MNTEFNTTSYEFGCACVDSDARLCFELRYPNLNSDDIYESSEKCRCSCHDGDTEDGFLDKDDCLTEEN